jgi:hypothetical protein
VCGVFVSERGIEREREREADVEAEKQRREEAGGK